MKVVPSPREILFVIPPFCVVFSLQQEAAFLFRLTPSLGPGFPVTWTSANALYLFLSPSIFIAFILEAFFVAYSLEKSEVETAIEKKIQELGVGIQE